MNCDESVFARPHVENRAAAAPRPPLRGYAGCVLLLAGLAMLVFYGSPRNAEQRGSVNG